MNLSRTSPENRRDYREDDLFITIESLRSELLEVAQERSLSDDRVVELSQRLDGYIVMAQNKMMESMRSRKNGAAVYNNATKAQRVRTRTAMRQ